MAEEKKSGFDALTLGEIIFGGLGILFAMWLFTGGPERVENKYNPFIEPLVEPLGDGSVYGAGGNFQKGVEELIETGVYVGWNIQNKKDFAFLTPPNWSSTTKGSIDNVEYGEIKNENITLEYQYGKKVNPLDFENNEDYLVEYGKVNGQWARFVKPRNLFAQTTGAHIKKNFRKKITIFTNQKLTPEEERQVFEIINTIRF